MRICGSPENRAPKPAPRKRATPPFADRPNHPEAPARHHNDKGWQRSVAEEQRSIAILGAPHRPLHGVVWPGQWFRLGGPEIAERLWWRFYISALTTITTTLVIGNGRANPSLSTKIRPRRLVSSLANSTTTGNSSRHYLGPRYTPGPSARARPWHSARGGLTVPSGHDIEEP